MPFPLDPRTARIDIKTEPLKKIKFYCPLKIMQIPDEGDYMDLDDYDESLRISRPTVLFPLPEILILQ